jgi:tripartite-type tricarboxylate transporter receptor subunit TctC
MDARVKPAHDRDRKREGIMRFATFTRAALAGLALAVAAPAGAQDYPARPVTMVVPFAAGGAGDILSRVLAPRLEQTWGKPLVVDTKPGAGGVIGAQTVARAAPDGYTLLIAPSTVMAVNVTLYKNLSYDPAADFVPLALAAQTPFVLVVNPDLPVHSVRDLIAYVKARPGQISYATAGPGVPHHLFAELFKSMTGIAMSPVAYRGSVPALTDVMAGHVPLMFVDLGPALSIVQSGKVRALGVSTAARLTAIPDVPPIAEAGVPGFDAASWQMVVAPAKTPQPVVDKLHGDLTRALAMPEIKDQIDKSGMMPMDSPSVAGLQAFVKSEITRWGKVVQQAGLAGTQ